jgi:hypothetical protein
MMSGDMFMGDCFRDLYTACLQSSAALLTVITAPEILAQPVATPHMREYKHRIHRSGTGTALT